MDNIYNMPPQGNPVPQNQSTAAMNLHQYASAPPPVNVPVPAAPFAPQPQGQGQAVQNFASNLSNPYAGAPPVIPLPVLDPAMQQQLILIKALADQGLSPDKIAGIMATMGHMGQTAGAGVVPPPAQYPAQNQNQNPLNAQNGWGESRDRNGYHEREVVRSPQHRFRQRSRSRSPPRGWNGHGSPATHRRDENRFDDPREQESPGRNRGGGRGRGNDYRQRSPPRRGHSPSPPQSSGGSSKWVGHDPSMPKGNIKGIVIIRIN